MTEKQQIASDTAAMIRRLLEAVDRGDLDASGPRAQTLVRRLRLTLEALEEDYLAESQSCVRADSPDMSSAS
jgi:hypothetical protein